MLCLFGATSSHFLGNYVGNLILTTLIPRPASLEAAQLGSLCTTHTYGLAQLSLCAKENNKKRQFLNELKRKIPKLSMPKLLLQPQFHLCKGSMICVAVMVNYINV